MKGKGQPAVHQGPLKVTALTDITVDLPPRGTKGGGFLTFLGRLILKNHAQLFHRNTAAYRGFPTSALRDAENQRH